MSIQIVSEQRPYRLVCDGAEHYAVLEARCGRVYPVHCEHCHPRDGAPDTADGMLQIARSQWEQCDDARSCYKYMVDNEERYAQMLW